MRHIAKVWSSYLDKTRVAAAAAAAAVSSTGGVSEDEAGQASDGDVPFLPLGISFGPDTEPGPLDRTGRLPNELLESMFDFLDEDQTMNCASVARRCNEQLHTNLSCSRRCSCLNRQVSPSLTSSVTLDIEKQLVTLMLEQYGAALFLLHSVVYLISLVRPLTF